MSLRLRNRNPQNHRAEKRHHKRRGHHRTAETFSPQLLLSMHEPIALLAVDMRLEGRRRRERRIRTACRVVEVGVLVRRLFFVGDVVVLGDGGVL